MLPRLCRLNDEQLRRRLQQLLPELLPALLLLLLLGLRVARPSCRSPTWSCNHSASHPRPLLSPLQRHPLNHCPARRPLCPLQSFHQLLFSRPSPLSHPPLPSQLCSHHSPPPGPASRSQPVSLRYQHSQLQSRPPLCLSSTQYVCLCPCQCRRPRRQYNLPLFPRLDRLFPLRVYHNQPVQSATRWDLHRQRRRSTRWRVSPSLTQQWC